MQFKNAILVFGTMTKRAKTDMVVLHHAAAKNCTVQTVHRWHKDKGWSGIGYHFFVRKNGEVWRGRPEDSVGAHTLSYNATSIGICFEGNFQLESMPLEQLKAGLELIEYIKSKYTIKRILGHGELRSTACPGKNFPLEQLKGGTNAENRTLLFQKEAIADGFKLPKYGADGLWGDETKSVAKKAVVKRRLTYKYKNLTRLVQQAVGVEVDGKCGKKTAEAISKWQKQNSLTVDGQWGINCWSKWRLQTK